MPTYSMIPIISSLFGTWFFWKWRDNGEVGGWNSEFTFFLAYTDFRAPWKKFDEIVWVWGNFFLWRDDGWRDNGYHTCHNEFSQQAFKKRHHVTSNSWNWLCITQYCFLPLSQITRSADVQDKKLIQLTRTRAFEPFSHQKPIHNSSVSYYE